MNTEKPKILAFLQNQWFRDPARVQAMYDRNPSARNDYIKTFLFMGCTTGKRLEAALGVDLCQRIVWEEASPKVGGVSGSSFAADIPHIENSIKNHAPDLIICFGKISGDAIKRLSLPAPVLYAPHPASRNNPAAELKALFIELSRFAAARIFP